MRLMPLSLAAAALLAGCGETPDPWLAQASAAAGAVAGEDSVIASHAAFDAFECIAETPILEVVQPGTLGMASVGTTTETYVDPLAELAAEDESVEVGPCDGAEYEASAILYASDPGVAGIDTVVYREFRDGGEPDRIHTVRVRVR